MTWDQCWPGRRSCLKQLRNSLSLCTQPLPCLQALPADQNEETQACKMPILTTCNYWSKDSRSACQRNQGVLWCQHGTAWHHELACGPKQASLSGSNVPLDHCLEGHSLWTFCLAQPKLSNLFLQFLHVLFMTACLWGLT